MIFCSIMKRTSSDCSEVNIKKFCKNMPAYFIPRLGLRDLTYAFYSTNIIQVIINELAFRQAVYKYKFPYHHINSFGRLGFGKIQNPPSHTRRIHYKTKKPSAIGLPTIPGIRNACYELFFSVVYGFDWQHSLIPNLWYLQPSLRQTVLRWIEFLHTWVGSFWKHCILQKCCIKHSSFVAHRYTSVSI